jgi:phosphocarrier protein HPr
MLQYQIQLHTIPDVKEFVNALTGLPAEADLSAGRHTVDAKSIIGIFSLDLSAPLTLTVYGEEDADYRTRLAPFLSK